MIDDATTIPGDDPDSAPVRRDPLSETDRRALMRRVRARDTAPEVKLRKALWAAGVRGWRLHARGIPGRPDMSWTALRLAVFVDGAFWHGHPSAYHGQSGPFWDAKIAANKARDAATNQRLTEADWTVLRF
jgi:DNA mismatch endonuclease (patch repair protein)